MALSSPAEMAAEGWVNYCRYFHSLEADITRTSQIAREDRFSKADRAKLKAAEPESCFDAVTRSLARQRTIAQPTPQGALVIEDGCGTRRVLGEAHLRAVRTFLATAARSANKRVADEEELLHLEAELENEITQTLPPGLATSRAASPTTDMQEWFGWGLGEEPSPIVSFDGLPLESVRAMHEAGLDCPDGAATQQGPATDRDATPVSLRTEGVAAAEDGDGAAVESVPAEESGVKEGYSTSSTIEPEPAEAVGGGGADRCPAKRRVRAAHHAAPDNKHATVTGYSSPPYRRAEAVARRGRCAAHRATGPPRPRQRRRRTRSARKRAECGCRGPGWRSGLRRCWRSARFWSRFRAARRPWWWAGRRGRRSARATRGGRAPIGTARRAPSSAPASRRCQPCERVCFARAPRRSRRVLLSPRWRSTLGLTCRRNRRRPLRVTVASGARPSRRSRRHGSSSSPVRRGTKQGATARASVALHPPPPAPPTPPTASSATSSRRHRGSGGRRWAADSCGCFFHSHIPHRMPHSAALLCAIRRRGWARSSSCVWLPARHNVFRICPSLA